MYAFCLFLTVAFSILRFLIPDSGQVASEDVFKDLAHIWVGFLVGMAYCNREICWRILPAAIIIVEIVAFFRHRG